MVDSRGRIILTDFGIARQAEGSTTTTMATAGAPAYMAPEQVRGDEATPQMDIYALGVVLYEMLTGGERPFTGEQATITGTTGEKVRWEQANLKPLSPRRFNPRISEELEAVVLTCLEKDPKKRFGSVQELLMAMQAVLGLAELRDPLPEPLPPVNENKTPKNNQQTVPKNELTGEALVRHRLSRLRWIGLGLAGVAILILGLFIGRSNPADFLFFQIATITPQPSPTLEPAPGATRTRETDGMVVVYVPAGPFIMGSNDGDKDEKPEHTATTGGYWIDRTEVTNGEYRQCVLVGRCQPPGRSRSYTRDEYYGNSQYDNHPVIYVNWEQARTYCAWAGGRLPSEKEWEKAARGENGGRYPWGNDKPNHSLANYDGKDTTAVGQYEDGKSPYGAYDMAGNVWEWVDDWYDKYPGGGEDSDFGEKYKVLRGGSWGNDEVFIRSASRARSRPSNIYILFGFRCLVSN